MCGIAGYVTADKSPEAQREEVIRSMTAAIRHRGPDGDGHWRDRDAGAGLGQRRLAIIDISPAGAQPMISQSGRYVIVYNGEIYNFQEIRLRLEAERPGLAWRGHSDTEVLLAAIDAWGLVPALQAANGMFAIALWDRQTRTLSLAVDRFGEKPLYYGWMGKSFLFGSELKALKAHPHWRGEIDRESLARFMQFSYVPAPHSIYRGIRKVEPGGIVTLDCGSSFFAGHESRPSSYWSTSREIDRVLGLRRGIGDREALDEFEKVLGNSVELRMVADVPLGAFLSGGFDSTSIVALMQKNSSRPVRTFTVGFSDEGYDEAPFAKAIAKHLGTDHSELYVTPKDAMDVIPLLPHMYDEPFADSSQIPTHLVSRMARQHVTVALSGDAGDELFAGYRRYFATKNWLIGAMKNIPHPLRQLATNLIYAMGPKRIDSLYRLSGMNPNRRGVGRLAMKFAEMLAARSPIEGYQQLIAAWPNPTEIVRGVNRIPRPFERIGSTPLGLSSIEQMMYADLMHYMPFDILTKVDRAAMATSLETRIPYLDPRVVEFAWSLPMDKKVRGNVGKWMIRELVYRYVPPAMMDRPKTGFGVPLERWLAGDLRPWAEDLLDEKRLAQEGYLNPGPIRALWKEHLTGSWGRQQHLWPVLVFQQWLRAETESAVITQAPRNSPPVLSGAS